MKIVLSIAGYDPSSGAGVTADLMVFAAHRLFGTSCITALTVQSTQGVLSTHPVPEEIVGDTLDCLDADLPPSGIKIGMVVNAHNIFRISNYLETVKARPTNFEGPLEVPVVLDPVIRSSSGRELLDRPGLIALQERILPQVDWITPNLDELAALLGKTEVDRGDIPAACAELQMSVAPKRGRRHCLGIIATGGHLDHPDDFLLMPSGAGIWLSGERVATRSTHGTGCGFSSTFLSRLVLGDDPEEAAKTAKRYVAEALRSARSIGRGMGPINHLWRLLQ